MIASKLSTGPFLLLFLLAALGLVACRSEPADGGKVDDGTTAQAGVTKAVARLEARSGSSVSGTVTFTKVDGGVRVEAKVDGLIPPSPRGFHVHEVGDCSAVDGSSAGGHFNPDRSPHGGPVEDAGHRHTGDLGNLAPNPESGTAVYDRVDPLLALSGPDSIVGRAVIVHAGEDDMKTQPTGNAGGRVACGVIEAAQ
jgi:Cu-Zn family superoxide dismutase